MMELKQKQARIILIASCLLLVILAGFFFALQTWMPFMWLVLVPALLGLLYWGFTIRRYLLDFLLMKTTKNGMNMGLLILCVLLFVVILNFLAVKKNKSFDFSTSGQFTLSPQSLQILKNLNSDLEIKFFYKEGAENVEATRKVFSQIVSLYQEASPKVKFEFVEMNSHPQVTTEFGANKGIGEAFVRYNKNINRIESQFFGSLGQKFNEQDVTNAIIKSTRTSKKAVYFVEGHSERDLDTERSETGILYFKQLLEKNSFVVKKINLLREGRIPTDAEALLIVGPQSDFQKAEVTLLENYLQSGGRLFLALDDQKDGGLSSFIRHFNVEFDRRYIFNILNTNLGQVVNSSQPTVAVDYSAQSEITKQFGANLNSIFNKPNSLKILDLDSTLYKTEALVKTPPASVALKSLTSENYDGQPQSFILAVEAKGTWNEKSKESHVILFSDADFLNNTLIYQNINRDLALNSISSLVQENDLISISPKEISASRMILSPPEVSQFFRFAVVGIIFPLPIIFLIFAVVIWLRRRHA